MIFLPQMFLPLLPFLPDNGPNDLTGVNRDNRAACVSLCFLCCLLFKFLLPLHTYFQSRRAGIRGPSGTWLSACRGLVSRDFTGSNPALPNCCASLLLFRTNGGAGTYRVMPYLITRCGKIQAAVLSWHATCLIRMTDESICLGEVAPEHSFPFGSSRVVRLEV
jgi:hypothetical protein